MCADKTVSCRLKIESLFYTVQDSLFWVQWIKSQTFHAGSESKQAEPAKDEEQWRINASEKYMNLFRCRLKLISHTHITNKSRPRYQTLLKPDAEYQRRIVDAITDYHWDRLKDKQFISWVYLSKWRHYSRTWKISSVKFFIFHFSFLSFFCISLWTSLNQLMVF